MEMDKNNNDLAKLTGDLEQKIAKAKLSTPSAIKTQMNLVLLLFWAHWIARVVPKASAILRFSFHIFMSRPSAKIKNRPFEFLVLYNIVVCGRGYEFDEMGDYVIRSIHCRQIHCARVE